MLRLFRFHPGWHYSPIPTLCRVAQPTLADGIWRQLHPSSPYTSRVPAAPAIWGFLELYGCMETGLRMHQSYPALGSLGHCHHCCCASICHHGTCGQQQGQLMGVFIPMGTSNMLQIQRQCKDVIPVIPYFTSTNAPKGKLLRCGCCLASLD